MLHIQIITGRSRKVGEVRLDSNRAMYHIAGSLLVILETARLLFT